MVLAASFGECLVRSLHDALRADVNPTAGRHLAIHRKPAPVEFGEMCPCGPARYQVRVRDQNPWSIRVSPEDAHRTARLHQQGFIGFEVPEARHDTVEIIPAPCGATDAAIDDEVLGILRNLRVEVVHQHPQRRLGLPGASGTIRSRWREHGASIGRARRHGRLSSGGSRFPPHASRRLPDRMRMEAALMSSVSGRSASSGGTFSRSRASAG